MGFPQKKIYRDGSPGAARSEARTTLSRIKRDISTASKPSEMRKLFTQRVPARYARRLTPLTLRENTMSQITRFFATCNDNTSPALLTKEQADQWAKNTNCHAEVFIWEAKPIEKVTITVERKATHTNVFDRL